MQGIKNIIFDLGGVLFDIDHSRAERAFEELGLTEFEKLYSQAEAGEIFQRLEKGTIILPEFYEAIRNVSGLSLSNRQIDDAWNSLLLDFRESSLEYLNRLRSRYSLFLLSNTNEIHVNAIRAIYNKKPRPQSFESLFQRCVYSFQTGTRKPDVECFEWILEKESLNPGETLFIDDSSQNIIGSEKAGMKGILLKKGMLIEDLGLLDKD
ncbi:MAG: HAD family phosphatase [Chitinophagaceae bacterium]|nr:HAD family phosphatase [Chitinophagaceae bacterium]